MPAKQPGQGMMNFVGQQYPAPATAQMMQQSAQQEMPMIAPYYAPYQHNLTMPPISNSSRDISDR
jgi:hypothetical protein